MNPSTITHNRDFTVDQYIELLSLAKKSYKFIGYQEIDASRMPFVLWRHDCDYSLNRSLRLARIEHQASIKSTFFLNVHSEFYNLLEKGQARIIKEIIGLGHDIGLHFDAGFYDIHSEDQLDSIVTQEASWLSAWFDVTPAAFSFHNPTDFLLTCDRDSYGGLLNTYSRTFKSDISYCSDSNGYWRFRRLRDVLEKANDHRLQVLTHSGWWQECELWPRERIFRCVYGRAEATLRMYYDSLEASNRDSSAGPAQALLLLKPIDQSQLYFLDFLWNRGRFRILFTELWRQLGQQVRSLCKATLQGNWLVPVDEIDQIFNALTDTSNDRKLLTHILGSNSDSLPAFSEAVYGHWHHLANQLAGNECKQLFANKLEDECTALCDAIASIIRCKKKVLGVGGTNSEGTRSKKLNKSDVDENEPGGERPAFDKDRWQAFKATVLRNGDR